MIGITGAAVLFLLNMLIAIALGMAVGRLACFFLHQPWGRGQLLNDAALSAVTAVIAVYVFSALDRTHHIWSSRVMLIFAISAASVLLKYVFSRHGPPGKPPSD